MIKKKSILLKLFIIFTAAQILVYFLNSDRYFQLPGMYIFLLGAVASGFVLFLITVWNKPINMYQIIVFILFACMPISMIANLSSNESGYVISYLLLLLMTLLFSSLELGSSDLKTLYNAYIALGLIISLLIIIVHKRYYAEESNRITIQIGSNPLIDPNYLGACLVAPGILSIKGAMEEKDKRILRWIAVGIICVGVFMTGSRGALLALAAGIFVIFVSKILKNFSLKTFLILTVAAVAAIIVAICFVPEAYFERMFNIVNWADGSNSKRFMLWKNALDMIIKRPFWGYGIGNTVASIGNAAHNSYLEIGVHLGLPAAILFAVLVFSLIFRKGNIYMRALMLSTAVWAIFIAAEVTFFLWLNISLCIAALNYERRKRNEIDKRCSSDI